MPPRQSRLRLLFDENIPWRVAAALLILEFQVSWVGREENGRSALPRGSSDEKILQHAQGTNQIVVTSDLGMVILCAQAGQRVIWLDPRGRQLRHEHTVLLVFKQISDWEERFEQANGPICLRAMRTTIQVLELDEAGRLACDRTKKISPARKPRKRTYQVGPLFSPELWVTEEEIST